MMTYIIMRYCVFSAVSFMLSPICIITVTTREAVKKQIILIRY